MVSMALEFLVSNWAFSLLKYGSGNRMLMSEAVVIMPLEFSYHATGVTG